MTNLSKALESYGIIEENNNSTINGFSKECLEGYIILELKSKLSYSYGELAQRILKDQAFGIGLSLNNRYYSSAIIFKTKEYADNFIKNVLRFTAISEKASNHLNEYFLLHNPYGGKHWKIEKVIYLNTLPKNIYFDAKDLKGNHKKHFIKENSEFTIIKNTFPNFKDLKFYFESRELAEYNLKNINIKYDYFETLESF